MWGDIIIAFLIAFVTAYVITPHTIRLANKVGAVDVPEDRRVNIKPMPRLGGIGVIAGFLVSSIYLIITMVIENKVNLNGPEEYKLKLIGFFLGIVILSIFAYIDDVKGVHPLVKLLGQTLAATVIYFFGIKIEEVNVGWLDNILSSNPIFEYILTVGWVVGITNAINLIDGLDGLSSGITLISCVSLLIIFALNGSPIMAIMLITALAGAITGFLPYNVNPAKTFIGDVGAQFLGFAIAIISILGIAKTYTLFVVVAPLIVLALPIFDTLFAIVRRMFKGKSVKAVFEADNGHLHHRLMQRGYTQKQSVGILYGITTMLGVFAIILFESGVYKAISFALIVIAITAIGYKDILKINNNDDENKENIVKNKKEG